MFGDIVSTWHGAKIWISRILNYRTIAGPQRGIGNGHLHNRLFYTIHDSECLNLGEDPFRNRLGITCHLTAIRTLQGGGVCQCLLLLAICSSAKLNHSFQDGDHSIVRDRTFIDEFRGVGIFVVLDVHGPEDGITKIGNTVLPALEVIRDVGSDIVVPKV
jgi:hypothetical protein